MAMNKTMYLNAIANECIAEMIYLGIPVKRNITFSVNTRAKARFGQCCHNRRTGKYSINIMDALCTSECKRGLKQVIIHELLHTCDGCMNHGKVWKDYANKVNKHTGLNVSRTNSYEELGLERPKAEETAKYIITCNECGNKWYRDRASNITKYPEHYHCTCGGRISVEQAR